MRRAAVAEIAPVRLELSGPRLSQSLARLAAGAEAQGGIERYVEALKLKSTLFRDAFGDPSNPAAALEPETFKACARSCRPCAGASRAGSSSPAYDALRDDVAEFVAGIGDTAATDSAARRVRRALRAGRPAALGARSRRRTPAQHRAGALSADEPLGLGRRRQYRRDPRDFGSPRTRTTCTSPCPTATRPSSCCARSSANSSRRTASSATSSTTSICLCAQVYAEYICEQGGSYLRTDFSAEQDPLRIHAPPARPRRRQGRQRPHAAEDDRR